MSIRSEEELEGMVRAGRVVRSALEAMREAVRPGITTAELDEIGEGVLRRCGARSAPQRDYGFPGVNCISLNDEAVHGIPGMRKVKPGDLVKLDVTADLDGFIADAAITVPVRPAPPVAERLCACAESAFRKGMQVARAGRPVREIGRAVEGEVRRQGFRVLRELCGHGVGRSIHEEPSVPNYFDPRLRDTLTEGLVLTVEPIIAARTDRVVHARDGWTVRTLDGSLSAHYEQTLLITRGTPRILTAL